VLSVTAIDFSGVGIRRRITWARQDNDLDRGAHGWKLDRKLTAYVIQSAVSHAAWSVSKPLARQTPITRSPEIVGISPTVARLFLDLQSSIEIIVNYQYCSLCRRFIAV
jgi:hypothetical protein